MVAPRFIFFALDVETGVTVVVRQPTTATVMLMIIAITEFFILVQGERQPENAGSPAQNSSKLSCNSELQSGSAVRATALISRPLFLLDTFYIQIVGDAPFFNHRPIRNPLHE